MRNAGRGSWTGQLRFVLDETLLRFAVLVGKLTSASGGSGSLLIPPAGHGNIGDQAMLEAYLAHAPGSVTVLARKADDFPDDSTRGHKVVPVELAIGLSPRGIYELFRLARLLRAADDVSLTGADMMDGNYSVVGAVRRIRAVRLAALLGRPTRVLGFSWSPAPTPPAPSQLLLAREAGVVLLARDPVSAARLRELGADPVDAADIVFSVDDADEEGARQQLERAGLLDRRYALVNASALVARGGEDQVAAYVKVVSLLRNRGIEPLLLPHVVRPGKSDDSAALRAVGSACGQSAPALVEDVLRPATVRALAAGAEIVVTGRMHLGVMSLRMGTVPVIISTQGKVEGLMQLFGVPELAVPSGAEVAVQLPVRVEDALNDIERLRATIRAALPSVVERAQINFAAH